MGNYLSGPAGPAFLPVLAIALVLLGFLVFFWRGHQQRLRRNTEVFWFSSLHLFNKELSQCQDPEKMAAVALRSASEMLNADEGYILLREAAGGKVHCSMQAVSARGAEGLNQVNLRQYLLSSAERWGALMVFPDLRRSEVVEEWQRDPTFERFREVVRSEGLRTLLVIGLRIYEISHGTLILGFRRARSFSAQQLRVALSIGGQLSVSVENWNLNRAAARRKEGLRILHLVAEGLRATFDMHAQIEILRRELKGMLGGTNFGLDLQDSPEGPLEVTVPFENVGSAGTVQGAPANSLAQYVQRTKQPLMLSGAVSEAASRLGLLPMNPGIKSWCGVPLHFSDGSMGVLELVDLERENALQEPQFELVQVLARDAAGAVENARLFKREQRRSSHLGLLNELGAKPIRS